MRESTDALAADSGLREALGSELHRSRRLGEPFSVLMLDADHFKEINDRHGHAAGDRALQHLGTLLAAHMRDIDRVCRYGGEEFVVLLPGTGLADARVTAERLREKVQGLRSLDELQKRSTDDIDWFWTEVLKDLDIRFDRPYAKIVDLSKGVQWPRWCVGGRMNIVQSMLEKHEDGRPALIAEGEEGKTRTMSYRALRCEVNKAANALRALGIGKGDVVGVFMPMTA